MKRLTRLLPLVVLAAAAQATSARADTGTPPDADDLIRLKRLLVQDCGSCHGLQMNGGLGPALRPQDLSGKPVSSLVATILHGRPGTAMPPWQRLLNEDEAQWLVEQLLKGL